MICESCGREVDEVRRCTICKKVLCMDCVRYFVVKKKTIYKEYEDSIPVCKDCLPKTKLKKKLENIVKEVFEDLM